MKKIRIHRFNYAYGAIVFVFIFAAIGVNALLSSHAAAPTSAPSAPPVTWCENGLPSDPYTSAPSGAVIVTPANVGSYEQSWQLSQNTTYWFTPGTYNNVGFQPQTGDVFIGGYDAATSTGVTLNGGGTTEDAFDGFDGSNGSFDTTNITIEYFTITDYTGGGDGQANVNHDFNSGWTIEDNDIENTVIGAGLGMGSNNVVTDNCLYNNAEYGFMSAGDSSNITLTNNDIGYNDSDGQYDYGAMTYGNDGEAGGGKFWETTDATITGNYVHNNGDPGIWADTDNAGFNISDNYISDNRGEGIVEEISYNFQIENNTLIGNDIGENAGLNPGVPGAAIYISESGSDPRVNTPYNTQSVISGNVLTNNWGGVSLYENANRWCGGPTGDNACTLVDPSVDTLTSCPANIAEQTPIDYYDNCKWKTQNVLVSDNTFNLTPSDVSPDCTAAEYCGENALFSFYGGAPYTGAAEPNAITFNQDNEFSDNTYNGPWSFFVWNQGMQGHGDPVAWSVWSAPITDSCTSAAEESSGICTSGFGQDGGSTYNGTAGVTTVTPPPAAPTNLSSVVNSPTSVSLSWTASTDSGGPGIAGYYVLRNGVNITPSGITSTSWTDTTAAPATTYGYSIEAYDSADPPNVSAASSAVSVTTPSPVSSTGNSPNCTALSGDVIEDKTFEDGTDAMAAWFNDTVAQSNTEAHCGRYSLAVTSQIPSGQGSNWGVIEDWPGQAAITPGDSYTFSAWVRAGSNPELINAYINWVNSSGSSIDGPVSIGSATDSSTGWTEITGTAVAPAGTVNGAFTFTSPASTTGEVHYFDDIAITTNGTATAVSPPSSPTGLTAKATSQTSVDLSWTASSDSGGPGIAGYYVLRNGNNITPAGISTTSYVDNGVVASTTYTYQVEAYDSEGNVSPSSPTVSITTPAPPAPAPPTQPTELSADVVSSTQINLTWQSSSSSAGVAGYDVYRNGALVASIATTSYGDTGLTPSTTYSYYVVAFDGSGDKSTASTSVSATTLATVTTADLEGVVTSKLTGAVLSGVRVTTSTDIGGNLKVYSTKTNSQGQFLLGNLPPNVGLRFVFSLSGYRNSDVKYTLNPGETVKNIVLNSSLFAGYTK